MKLFASLLVTVSLIIGAIAAGTSYLAPVSDGAALVGLTPTAPAGARPPTEEEMADVNNAFAAGELTPQEFVARRESARAIVDPDAIPGAAPDDPAALTPEAVELLAAEGVEYVCVLKEFSFGRWTHWWAFALAVVGLLAGSLMLRAASKAAVAAPSPTAGLADRESPEFAIQEVEAVVAALLRDLPGMTNDEARCDAIVDRLGDAQRTHMVAFVDARTRLIARLGLAGFAMLMDRFAAAERTLSRAWSAAADKVYPEALDSLERGATLLEETRAKLR